MPYIFVEELSDGQEAADVVERETLKVIGGERDAAKSEVEEIQAKLETAESERTKLIEELAEAKSKFANAFLDGAIGSKPVEKTNENEAPCAISTFDELFN